MKTYYGFDWLFFNNQSIITIFLLINAIYFTLLILNQNSVLKFSVIAQKITNIAGILLLFSFYDSILGLYFYYLISVILSMALLYGVSIVLFSKFKTDKISAYDSSVSKNRFLVIFILIAGLNMAKVPLLPLFSSALYGLSAIFSIQYDYFVMNLMPYVILICLGLLSFATFNLIYKVLIETNKKEQKKSLSLSYHQILTVTFLIFGLFIINIYPDYFFDTFLTLGL